MEQVIADVHRFPAREDFFMAKNREKQKANKQKGREERLNLLTEWNTKDPTPKQAVDNIIAERK